VRSLLRLCSGKPKTVSSSGIALSAGSTLKHGRLVGLLAPASLGNAQAQGPGRAVGGALFHPVCVVRACFAAFKALGSEMDARLDARGCIAQKLRDPGQAFCKAVLNRRLMESAVRLS
jgi:hypothetical protein